MGDDENSHVRALREVYARWADGDISETEVFHPDIQVIWAPDMPDAKVDHGVAELQATMDRTAEVFTDMRIVATDFIPKDDKVVVLVEWSATGKATGLTTNTPGGHVWTFAGDRAIRIEGFFSHEDALRAAGIPPG